MSYANVIPASLAAKMLDKRIDDLLEEQERTAQRHDEWWDGEFTETDYEALAEPEVVEDKTRCEDYSWLLVDQCAHCRGHVLDPELEPVARAAVMGQ